ncbi:MAG: hypothetical protein AAB035_04800 [Nitrospirota bacterium]
MIKKILEKENLSYWLSKTTSSAADAPPPDSGSKKDHEATGLRKLIAKRRTNVKEVEDGDMD